MGVSLSASEKYLPHGSFLLSQQMRYLPQNIKKASEANRRLAVRTRLELVTSCVTGRHSNQLN